MKELQELIFTHIAQYPKMQVQDLVKLLYQSEFGGGHMIPNEAHSLRFLEEEIASLSPDTERETPFEEIGGGLCRVYLDAPSIRQLSPRTLNRLFVQSANSIKGTREGFEKKLSLLTSLCQEGKLPFSSQELALYLRDYREKGYPAVSHSPVYREAYLPAYRVIRQMYTPFFPLFSRIDTLLQEERPVRVGIDGNCGSGKSTLAKFLREIYPCRVIHMDDFFLPFPLRTQERLAQAGGNVHYERFIKEVLPGLKNCEDITYRPFDCSVMELGKAITLPKQQLTIVEGSYSHHPKFEDPYDLKVCLTASLETQKKRILRRNGEEMLHNFLTKWIPMEESYFAAYHIKETSDFVICAQ